MKYDLKLMFDISSLYYKKNMTQESIARRLNISKYKVNRILKIAKFEGMIKIIKPKLNFIKIKER